VRYNCTESALRDFHELETAWIVSGRETVCQASSSMRHTALPASLRTAAPAIKVDQYITSLAPLLCMGRGTKLVSARSTISSCFPAQKTTGIASQAKLQCTRVLLVTFTQHVATSS